MSDLRVPYKPSKKTYSKRLADCGDDIHEGIVTEVGKSLEDTQQRL
jgi:hypothetical protein